MTIRNRTAALSAANAVSPWITYRQGGVGEISGTFVGTLTLQRQDSQGNAVTVTGNTGTPVTFTTPQMFTVDPFKFGAQYRLIMSAYTSGTANTVMEGR